MKLFSAFILAFASFSANAFNAKVIKVADGDTVTVLDDANTQIKIRLANIDAPEKKQAFGQRSKERLSKLVFGQRVFVEAGKKDRYGRVIGTLYFNGINVNLELVAAGYAWCYRRYLEDPCCIGLEQEAKQNRLGLWSDDNAVAPWEFRKFKASKR